MRYARLIRFHPALDTRIAYRVVRDSDVPGYIWIEGDRIGDPFLNPNQRCVHATHFEVWDDPASQARTYS